MWVITYITIHLQNNKYIKSIIQTEKIFAGPKPYMTDMTVNMHSFTSFTNDMYIFQTNKNQNYIKSPSNWPSPLSHICARHIFSIPVNFSFIIPILFILANNIIYIFWALCITAFLHLDWLIFPLSSSTYVLPSPRALEWHVFPFPLILIIYDHSLS